METIGTFSRVSTFKNNTIGKKIQIAILFLITTCLLFWVYFPRELKYRAPFEIEDFEHTDNGTKIKALRLNATVKRILHWTTHYNKKTNYNREIICGRNKQYKCHLTSDQSLFESSHALLFHGWREDMRSKEMDTNRTGACVPIGLPPTRFPDQYYILTMLEPPSNFRTSMRCYEDLFNWTMNYRTDSEGYVPYGRFHLRTSTNPPLNRERLKKKTKLILWVVSNCGNVSSGRGGLVDVLKKYVPVDTYGRCGNLTCAKNCKKVLGKQYKFYLALENNVCQDYVTEKAFLAYDAGMVPIVYGAANYNLFLPHGSYINMNTFPTAKALADYLLYLDQHPEEYAMYFEWQRYYRLSAGQQWDNGYCRICERLHLDYPAGRQKIIPNVTEWLYEPEQKYRACAQQLKW